MSSQMFDLSWGDLNAIDVTADQSAIDATSYLDWSSSRENLMVNVPSGAKIVQVGFYGEVPDDDTASFGCELWGVDAGGIPQQICDITGQAGSVVADMTNADNTTRCFMDDITVSDNYWGDITVGGVGNEGLAFIEFTTRGLQAIWPRYYNIADATECDRIKGLVRFR